MEAMTKHRSHSAAFERQVAEEFIAGETLHALSKRHDISRQLIRIWVGKFEAGALDDDVQAADLIQEYEAKIAALERMVGRQALEIELLKGALKHAPRPRSANTSLVTGSGGVRSPAALGRRGTELCLSRPRRRPGARRRMRSMRRAGCAACLRRPSEDDLRQAQRQERRPLRMSLRREGTTVANYTVCVRSCDGAFFPVSYFGAPSDALEQACRLLCPHTGVALYSFPFGGTIDQAVSPAGEPYSHLPNAGKFQQTYDPACSCRAPGQSWAEALAPAQAKYRRHSQDVVVSAEAAERMSRPVQDPKSEPAAADPGQTLDVNGDNSQVAPALIHARGG
jgi:transposase